MAESIQEYVDSRGVTVGVDAAVGVLRGVKLIGLTSRNGRRYRESALAAATTLYEDAKVNVNHPKDGPLSPRDYQDRLGVVRGVELRKGEGLFGDLHFNPKHALAEQLVWDAQHQPHNVGFSHNVLARLVREGETTVVEEITKVQSVDLVADPAATHGLFEQQRSETVQEQLETAQAKIATLERKQRILQLLCEHRLAIAERSSADQASVSREFVEWLEHVPSDEAVETLIAERAEMAKSASHSANFPPLSSEQSSLLDERGPALLSSADFAATLKPSLKSSCS